MSGGVQTPLSPVLQESKTTPNKQGNKHKFFHKKSKSSSNHNNNNNNNNQITTNHDKFIKKRQKKNFPNKFLLGGNVNDPLNLNGLLNDANEENSINHKSSSTSVLPKPSYRIDAFDVILRPNIKDPLNLEGTYDDVQLNEPIRKPRKHRRSISRMDSEIDNKQDHDINDETNSIVKNDHIRKRKRAHSLSVNGTNYEKTNKITCTVSEENININRVNDNNFNLLKTGFNRSVSCMQENFSIISAVSNSSKVVANSSVKKVSIIETNDTKFTKQVDTVIKNKINDGACSSSSTTSSMTAKEIKYEKNGYKYRYGNYIRYYINKNEDHESDHRLDYLKSEWFKNKNILDIGCNVGHVTLHIAKNYQPKKIVGIDIDVNLIYSARKNIRHYMDKVENEKNKYPISCEIVYGSLMTQTTQYFPNNIYFTKGDYVPKNDDYLNEIKPDYDFILALSITKWIHLNNGDDGIKRFFKKIYLNLTPNGSLLLEPQSWTSYKKKSKLCKEIWENYNKIKFKPNEFTKYLLSKEIGFSTCKTIAMPHNKSKGYRRPILLFSKIESKIVSQTKEINMETDKTGQNR